MPEGKYFILISKHCSLSLGTQGNANDEGILAVLCDRNEMDDYQVWYEDIATGTIRSKANDLCLTAVDGENLLRLYLCRPGDQTQQWKAENEVVHHRNDTNKVLDIVAGRSDCGAEICCWDFHGGSNQLWEVVYLQPKMFYIISEMNGKALDVERCNIRPGASVILWDKKTGNDVTNQHWYEDRNGYIRSALNDFAFDGSQKEVTLQPFDENNQNRCWIIYGHMICMRHKQDQVLDVLGDNNESGAKVGVWTYHGKPNQRWRQEFV